VTPFDALVLAGGSGRRMRGGRVADEGGRVGGGGVDKAALEVGGMRLLDRVIAAVDGAGRIVVVGPRRPSSAAVVWTIEDPEGAGPAAAIVHGLSLVSAPLVVVLATDVPFAATVVPRLIAALADGEPESAVTVDQNRRRQPLIAAYRTAALRRRADERSSWANVAVRTLVERLSVAEVDAVGSEALDCDTPQQLALARAVAEAEAEAAAKAAAASSPS
jgi:molybdopterin-guanine dinucleotide biosynthesis protein A